MLRVACCPRTGRELRTIYHITTSEAWEAARPAGVYAPASLAREGFVHCSTREQVIGTADRLFAGQDGLVVLVIDPQRLAAAVRHEDLGGSGEAFPHVYGPIDVGAVRSVAPLVDQSGGGFLAPPELDGRPVFIRAREHDGAPHWEHPAWLVRASGEIVITHTEPDLPIARGDGRGYTSPYRTRAHYWPDRWFNVIRLEAPGKGLNGFYCNVASPVEYDGESVRYVDLQLDVRVHAAPDGSLTYAVLDEDEFDAACSRYGYDDELIAHCRAAVSQLVALIEARAFPFDA